MLEKIVLNYYYSSLISWSFEDWIISYLISSLKNIDVLFEGLFTFLRGDFYKNNSE